MISQRLNRFFRQVENDVFSLAELLESSSDNLNNRSVIAIFKSFIRHKSFVTDLTLVRKDATNVMVWQEEGEPLGAELNGDLDDESIEIAVSGHPGDENQSIGNTTGTPLAQKSPALRRARRLARFAC